MNWKLPALSKTDDEVEIDGVRFGLYRGALGTKRSRHRAGEYPCVEANIYHESKPFVDWEGRRYPVAAECVQVDDEVVQFSGSIRPVAHSPEFEERYIMAVTQVSSPGSVEWQDAHIGEALEYEAGRRQGATSDKAVIAGYQHALQYWWKRALEAEAKLKKS